MDADGEVDYAVSGIDRDEDGIPDGVQVPGVPCVELFSSSGATGVSQLTRLLSTRWGRIK